MRTSSCLGSHHSASLPPKSSACNPFVSVPSPASLQVLQQLLLGLRLQPAVDVPCDGAVLSPVGLLDEAPHPLLHILNLGEVVTGASLTRVQRGEAHAE